MSVIPHERSVDSRFAWLQITEMWASLAITVIWLAVLFDAIFGPRHRLQHTRWHELERPVGSRGCALRDHRHVGRREVRVAPQQARVTNP